MQNSTTSTTSTVATGTNSQNNTGTFQIPPLLSLHFEELKKEMTHFGQSFNDWVTEKRRILTDDKENFLKTLAEEAGKKCKKEFFLCFLFCF
jgi:DNA-binding SARP family transcriptional activator